MTSNNSFRESLKVDSETLAELDGVSKNYAKKAAQNKSSNLKPGGRERGDDGPGKIGRESGFKIGNEPRINAVKNTSSKTSSANSSARSSAVKGINATGKNSGISNNGKGNGQNSSGGNGQNSGGQGK